MNEVDASEAIRVLNDRLRQTGVGGRQLITPGINEMGLIAVMRLRRLIADFDGFSEDNDPHKEHDFGSIGFQGQTVFWKIDYYDRTLAAGSPEPSDPDVTTRVLTIMLAQEY
jgi:Protein of unknown function (DUF3768)